MAQTQAVPGDLSANLATHLDCLARAAALGADLVAFPELSLTGYEPGLAGALQMDLAHPALQALAEEAQRLNLLAAVGFPCAGDQLPRITLAILGAPEATFIHKHDLHADELPFFEAGPPSDVVEVCGTRVGFLICYELSCDARIEALLQQKPDLIIASVAKTAQGMVHAKQRLQLLSQSARIPVLVVNAVGPSDGVVCGGESAAWRGGEQVGALNSGAPDLLAVTP